MHTRAFNSELVEPLPKPERTLNRILRRRIRRVPFEQRNNPPQHPRVVYPPILNINYFRHFLNILQNYDLIDDEPMWVADCVVTLTLGSVINIPKTANEFAIKGSSNSDIDKIMARMDAMTIKMDARYKEPQSRAKQPKPGLDDDDIPMSREEEAKFMQTFQDSKVPLILGRPFLYTADALIRVKQKQLNLVVETERMIFNIDSAIKHSYSNDDTCFSINVINEILEEDFDALLDEGKIKDKKGTENVAADHLSRIENNETSDDSKVDDNFPRETLMEINTRNEPWFADFENYLVGDIIPKEMTYQQKNKFFSDLKHCFGKNLIFSKYVLTENDDEWLMATVTPPRATVTFSSNYEVGGPSTTTPGTLILAGQPFPGMIRGTSMLPSVIDDLCMRMGNLEYGNKALVQTLQTSLHGAEVQNQQLRARLAKMKSREATFMSYMLWMDERFTVLEKKLPGRALVDLLFAHL
nr:reverse transcriptase domain-containing protein [Tanacetum cinerariifolium]